MAFSSKKCLSSGEIKLSYLYFSHIYHHDRPCDKGKTATSVELNVDANLVDTEIQSRTIIKFKQLWSAKVNKLIICCFHFIQTSVICSQAKSVVKNNFIACFRD